MERRWTSCGFDLSHKSSNMPDTFGHIEAGKMMIMLDRGDYWQCAYVIPKGGIERMKSEGLEASQSSGGVVAVSVRPRRRTENLGRRQIAQRHRRSAGRNGGGPGSYASAMRRMRCRRSAASASIWRCRMRSPPPTGSPDRFARARLRTRIFRRSRSAARCRCASPNGCSSPSSVGSSAPRYFQTHQRPKPPSFFKLFNGFPALRRIPAQLIGVGIRPEHVQTPEAKGN